MTLRPATVDDAALILDHLAALPNPPYQEDVAGILASPTEHVWIDDELGYVCRIAVSQEQQTLVVVWLLPRAAWTVDNSKLLHLLLTATLRAAHDSLKVDERQWVVSAAFQDGRDAKGDPDGGTAICEFWRDTYFTDPDDPVRSQALVLKAADAPDGKAQIAMTIALATEVGEKVAADPALVDARIEDAKAAALAEIAMVDALAVDGAVDG